MNPSTLSPLPGISLSSNSFSKPAQNHKLAQKVITYLYQSFIFIYTYHSQALETTILTRPSQWEGIYAIKGEKGYKKKLKFALESESNN